MKKSLIIGALLLAMTAATTGVAAENNKGGLMGGLYGCCFGLRGAAAYNDGKRATAIEWIDALLTAHIIAAIYGWSGDTTADLRAEFGDRCF